MAREWKVIDRVPRIRLLPGERNCEFVRSPQQERDYLASAPQSLRDVAMLILDTGLRVGEALAIDWRSVRLEPAEGAKFGFFHVREGKSKNAKRNVPLTARVRTMLEGRKGEASTELVFTDREGLPIPVERIDHWHAKQRLTLKLPADFVLHSLRHTMLTRRGESNTDAFTIMRVAGHSTVVVSQRYVHPSPEAIERAFERPDALNGKANAALKSAACSPAVLSAKRQPVSLPVETRRVPKMLSPPTNVPTANAATGNLSD